MYGLDPSVITQRKSRLTYGVAVLNRFDPARHPQAKRVQIGPHIWCTDVYDKFVKVHQTVRVGEMVRREYCPAKLGQKACVFNVYCTDREAVRFVTDRGVTKCGTLTLTLPEAEGDESATGRRSVQMWMSFADTEIRVSAVDMLTGRGAQASMDFLMQ